ncbi:MAG TPA: protein kinase [Kribbella sp.]|nr:protein kinase [Kribbella sp.]
MLVAKRYRLGEPLGRGGMAEVWQATDEVLGRPVAVKLLPTSVDDEIAEKRFQLEAQAAARLNDPHVVAVYDYGTHDGRSYLVMELMEGRSLACELRANGLMDAAQAADVGAQTAAGLAAAHGEGVVHRDIKPSNLLLSSDGTVKIADFGIARVTDAAVAELTTADQIVGTSLYLAPERAIGEPAGPESDVYSLGCVLYELVTGRPPFTAEAPAGVLYQHVDTAPIPPGEIRPGLPAAFEDYLLRLLAKDPSERPTAEQVAEHFAATTPLVIRPERFPVDDRSTTIANLFAQPVSRAAGLQTSSTKALAGVAGVLLLGAAVVVGLVPSGGTDRAPAQTSPTSSPTVSPSAPTTPAPARQSASPRSEPADARQATTSRTSGSPTTGETGRDIPDKPAKSDDNPGKKRGKG